MFDFLKQVYFLEDFPFTKIIFHIAFLDRLDRHLLPGKLVHAQRDFPECALPYELNELVELQCGRRQLVLLVYVTLDVLDQLVPLLQ